MRKSSLIMVLLSTYLSVAAAHGVIADQAKIMPSIQLTQPNLNDSAIRLEARQAPLGQILKEITAKTGAVIHYSVLPEAPVTATCAGANIWQLMDCLVAKQIGLVTNKPEPGKPAEYWLLGTSVGSCQATTVEPADSFMQAQSTDPQQRAEGIRNLGAIGLKNDPDIDNALRNAMNDKDAIVREQAIRSIALLAGDDVADRQSLALKDKDVNVRLTALSDIKDDPILLQQALNDIDQSVRNLAQIKLEDLVLKQREVAN
jgi:HEAT repeat protein